MPLQKCASLQVGASGRKGAQVGASGRKWAHVCASRRKGAQVGTYTVKLVSQSNLAPGKDHEAHKYASMQVCTSTLMHAYTALPTSLHCDALTVLPTNDMARVYGTAGARYEPRGATDDDSQGSRQGAECAN